MHQKKKNLVHQQHVLKLANVTTNPCLMWPYTHTHTHTYISYVIKLRTKLLRSLRLL